MATTRKTKTAAPAAPAPAFRARIRMYRQGLGDCFLVTLPKDGGGLYSIMIDCGVILGTPDAGTLMTKVVEDIIAETGGTVDLLVATHEHWDHLSGFIQAADAFGKLKVKEVWLGWTEDPQDKTAQSLVGDRAQAVTALSRSRSRLQLAGDAKAAAEVGGMLEFFGVGAAGGGTTKEALEAVRAKAGTPRYCRPDAPPFQPDRVAARIYVLGPPTDLALLKKSSPSRSAPETYGFDGVGLFLNEFGAQLAGEEPDAPFSPIYVIPGAMAREMPFFKGRYWGGRPEGGEGGEAWRRIESVWLAGSSDFALKLDADTNNTSLVIAIELGAVGGDVLLFAADAQVGNWLSWQDLTWTVDGRAVTGPDLLRRTLAYKVGHHGSHNATLREKGLETMGRLKAALLPVDKDMAMKKRWGRMPLPELLTALDQKTGGQVLRSDADRPGGAKLYHDYLVD